MIPPATTRHRDARKHFMHLQQANDHYHSLDLQLEINHCADNSYRIVSRHGTSYYIQDHMTIQQGPIPQATHHYMQQVLTQFPPSCLVLTATSKHDSLIHQMINTQFQNGYDYALFIQPNRTTIDPRWLTLRNTHEALYYYTPELLALTSSDKIIDHLDRAKPRIQADGAWNPVAAAAISQAITDHILTYPVIATNTESQSPDTTLPTPPAPVTTAIEAACPAATAPESSSPAAKPKSKGKGKGKRPRKLPPDHTPADAAEQPRPAREPTPYDECVACRGNQSQYDPRHTRIPGKCKHPFVETPVWTCPGCIKGDGRWVGEHNYRPGECKHFDQQTRVSPLT